VSVLRYELMRHDRLRQSFTLIELVITIVVVAIIALPLAVMLAQQAESTVRSQDFSTALNLARLEIEKVNNLAYTAITSDSVSDYEGYPFDLTRTVVYVAGSDAAAESLKQITVRVSKAGNATPLASLVTYIARNVNYGGS
jgi:type II secretory pathway pseudopilin PulG